MPAVYFPKGEEPEMKPEDVIGSFYDAGEDKEMLVYLHKDHQEDDDLPILEELPPADELLKMLYTKSFLMAKPVADRFRKVFEDLREGRMKHVEVDSAD